MDKRPAAKTLTQPLPTALSTKDPQDMQSLLGKRRREEDVDLKVEIKSDPESPIIHDTDHSDDESELSEEDAFKPYDIEWRESQEDFPPLAAYHENMPAICNGLLTIFPDIRSIFDRYQVRTENVRNLQHIMADAQSLPKIQPIRIGLLGDAGVGMVPDQESIPSFC